MKAIGRKQNVSCLGARYVGNYLYVAAHKQSGDNVIYRYDIINNSWETLPPFLIRSTAYVLLMITFMQSVNPSHFRDIVWLKTIGQVELT